MYNVKDFNSGNCERPEWKVYFYDTECVKYL